MLYMIPRKHFVFQPYKSSE